jgi:hypothetical protein
MARKQINIRAGFDLSHFSDSQQNLIRSLRSTATEMKSVGREMSMSLTAPLALIGGFAIKSAADFESLKTSLVTSLGGSKDAASAAFKEIEKFASSTPFQMEEVTGAFIKLKNMGLDPSMSALESYGNTASSMGKSLNDMVEAVADAAVGEFERLKEFGIKAKSQGDNVSFTFKGVTTTVKKNSEEIEQYLQNIGNTEFAGGIEAQSKTFNGTISTLSDNVSMAAASFGDLMLPALQNISVALQSTAEIIRNLNPETKSVIITTLGLTAAIGPLIYAIGALSGALAFLAANPITAILIAIAAAVVAINIAAAQTNQIFAKVQITIDLMKESYKKLGDEIAEIDKLKKQGVKASQDEIKLRIASTRAVIAETYELVKQAYQKKKALLDEKKAQMDAVMAQTRSVGAQGEFQGADLAKVANIQKNIDALNEEIKTSQTEIVNAAKGTKDLEAQLQSLGKVDLAPVGDKIGKVGKEIKKLGIDLAKGIAASDLQSPAIDAIQKGLKSKGLTFDEPIKVPLEIDIKPIEITQELFDQQAIAAAKRQAADLGEEMGDALSSGLKALATETLISLGEFLGDSLTSKTMMNDQLKNTEEHYDNLIKAAKKNGEDIAKLEQEKADMVAKIQESFTFENRVEDFGRGLLDSIGKFMSQFGEAMIAIGIGQVMLDVAIKSFNPALAIIGGIALVAAGAAISNLSKKGISEGSSGGSSFSGGGNFSSMSGIGANMQPIVLDTRISGRDMIITQGRESQFKR